MEAGKKVEQIVLKNVRVRYAKLIRPGTAFDEGQPDLWSVNMYVTDADRTKLLGLGATEKMDKDNNGFFIAKRNVVNKNREDVKPPVLVDGLKRPMTVEVGNGSICNIAVTPFEWEKGRPGTPAHRTGTLLYLGAVQVVKYVEPSGGADAFEVIEEEQAAEGASPDADPAPAPEKPQQKPIASADGDEDLPF